MKEKEIYANPYIQKYKDVPELYDALVNQEKKIDEYMHNDKIPPLHKGQRKKRLDIHDPDLALKCNQLDFQAACGMGNVSEMKRIVSLYKKPYQDAIINYVDEGISGLDLAYAHKCDEAIKYLLKRGAKETEHTPKLREEYQKFLEEMETKQNDSTSRLSSL